MSSISDRFDPDARIPEDRLIDAWNVRSRVQTLAELIDHEFPDGREKSLALTKLEEAVHWVHSAARTTEES